MPDTSTPSSRSPGPRRIDLHAHTIHSDGTFTPTELVAEAERIGLAALAVTDHDTTAALAEAHAAAADRTVEILDGCEISTALPTGIVHMLIYGFDVDDADLQAYLTDVRTRRDARNDAMYEKLAEIGRPLERADVERHAHGRIVARPHFAQAMVDRGYVRDIREAFGRFLRDGGPAYVPAPMPSPESAIEVATRAGAACVLAHPRQLKLDDAGYRRTLTSFKDAGLAGLEVDHPTHGPSDRQRFAALADAFDLVPTGGSDFHGDAKPHIHLGEGDGTIDVDYATWDRLKARRRRA